MDLLDETEKLRSRVNTVLMGLASLCQQCLLTGKLCEMERFARKWEKRNLKSDPRKH